MREHRQLSRAVRMADDDYAAWLDDDDEPVDADFAAGLAAMREVERDWWASAFDGA